ncbi:MAG: ABC transporter ATP-binding protein [Planctomycetota bacterium]
MAPVVQLRSVHKSVREGETVRPILCGVDLEVGAGESVAIVGRSGSGKSTLLNVIAGLDGADAGTVAIGGQLLQDLDEAGRARLRQRQVGFVFQSFHLLPTLTALENIALPLELAGRPAAAGRARAAELLARVGLGDRQGAFPAVLSGGEQQRVAAARALALRPPLVLADEPTGNLDDEAAAAVMDLLAELVRDHGSALLVVTHAAAVAARCERRLRLEHGVLAPVADGTRA